VSSGIYRADGDFDRREVEELQLAAEADPFRHVRILRVVVGNVDIVYTDEKGPERRDLRIDGEARINGLGQYAGSLEIKVPDVHHRKAD